MKYKISQHEDGSRVGDVKEASSASSTIQHIINMEKKALLSKLSEKINKKINQAEKKSEKKYRHYQAVIEGLVEALEIVEREYR